MTLGNAIEKTDRVFQLASVFVIPAAPLDRQTETWDFDVNEFAAVFDEALGVNAATCEQERAAMECECCEILAICIALVGFVNVKLVDARNHTFSLHVALAGELSRVQAFKQRAVVGRVHPDRAASARRFLRFGQSLAEIDETIAVEVSSCDDAGCSCEVSSCDQVPDVTKDLVAESIQRRLNEKVIQAN